MTTLTSYSRLTFYIGLHSSTLPNGAFDVEARKGLALLILAREFPKGLTSVRTVGQWAGVEEPSLCVEAVVEDSPRLRERARAAAYTLALRLKQDAVAVAFDAVDFELVGLDAEQREVA